MLVSWVNCLSSFKIGVIILLLLWPLTIFILLAQVVIIRSALCILHVYLKLLLGLEKDPGRRYALLGVTCSVAFNYSDSLKL